MSHQHLVRSFLLVLGLFGPVACGGSPAATGTPTPWLALPPPSPKTDQTPIDTIQLQWLSGTPCAPPCWEGITPGQTTAQAAAEILNRHPLIEKLQLVNDQTHQKSQLYWHWRGSSETGGIVEFPMPDPQDTSPVRVSWILVGFPHSFNLADIRAPYGDPSHVLPAEYSASIPHVSNPPTIASYDLKLVYLHQGFYLETERTTVDPPVIMPGMTLSGVVTFFPPPSAESDLSVESLFSGAELVPWQGFENFKTYCQQVAPLPHTGQLCGQKP